MRNHRQSLRALRKIALAHCRTEHPDLAALARELGGAIRQRGGSLQASLATLSAATTFACWPLHTRGPRGLRMAVMAWPANHVSPVHDHGSRWGLEISLHGALEVEAWERDPLNDALRCRARHWLGPGDAVWFDADEARVHRCRNLSRMETALTLHVYGGSAVHPPAYRSEPVQTVPAARSATVAIAGPLRS